MQPETTRHLFQRAGERNSRALVLATLHFEPGGEQARKQKEDLWVLAAETGNRAISTGIEYLSK